MELISSPPSAPEPGPRLRVEPLALVVLSVLALSLAGALVTVLLGTGTPVALVLAGGLVLTGAPAVWLLVRLGRRQELERERAKVSARKDGPAVLREEPSSPGKQLHY